MTDEPREAAPVPGEDMNAAKAEPKRGYVLDLVWFVVKVVIAVLIFRIFIYAPFTIPSESMLPRLWKGDYFVAAKWPYGLSNASLPLDLDLFEGRVFEELPERGDVVVFKHPVDGTDYIKRVIGLPGDTVELRRGRVILNGEVLSLEQAPPFDIPLSANTDCHPAASVQRERVCRYPRAIERLPSGPSYPVIDLGRSVADDFGPVRVPAGRLFLLGDNRDNSQDSRFPARPGGGIGMVPTDLLVGRASRVLFSSGGDTIRWDRIGEGL